jgi:hypothetical protein
MGASARPIHLIGSIGLIASSQRLRRSGGSGDNGPFAYAAGALVRDESPVPRSEHECRDAVLDPRQQPAHRCSVADPEVRDAVVVDIVAGLEEVDGAAEVDRRMGRPRSARRSTPAHGRPADSPTKSNSRAGCRSAMGGC